jgi:hypothetical protein
MYKALMILLSVFTLLDTILTRVGLGIGCVELNQFIASVGLGFWTVFRIGLLVYLLLVFFAGYRLFQRRFSMGIFVLKTGLVILNVYIGAVVFSGVFAILSILLV